MTFGTGLAPVLTVAVLLCAAAPATAAVKVDPASAVVKQVGRAGGTISGKGPGGATFALTIPKDALLASTTITATPITSAGGRGRFVTGVRLQPAGLRLYKIARLRLTTSRKVPRRHQRGFVTSNDGGTNAHLFPTLRRGKTSTLPLTHFSEYQQRYFDRIDANRMARTNPKGAMAQYERFVARGERSRAGDAEFADVTVEIVRDAFDTVAEPAMEAALKRIRPTPRLLNCGSGGIQPGQSSDPLIQATDAIQTGLTLTRTLQLLGADDDGAVQGRLYKVLGPLLEQGARCAVARCYQRADPSAIAFILSVARQGSLLGYFSGEFLQALFENAKQCGRIRVELDSTITQVDATPATWTMHVKGDLLVRPANFDLVGGVVYEGTAPMTYVSATGGFADDCAYGRFVDRRDGEMTTRFELTYLDISEFFGDPIPGLGLPVLLSPAGSGGPAETIEFGSTCDPPSSVQTPAAYWSAGWVSLHADVLGQPKLPETDFRPGESPYFAEALYPGRTFSADGLTYTENTTVRMRMDAGSPVSLPAKATSGT